MRWGDVSELKYGRALQGYREGTGAVEVYGTNGPVGWTDSTPLGEGPRPIVGRKGAYRGVHLAEGPFWVIDTAYWLEPTPDLDPRWAYYKLLTVDINGMDSGSAIPSLTRGHFDALPLLLPPVEEQRRIAGVLGALDELIDSNTRLADHLEGLLHAMFAQAGFDIPGDNDTVLADFIEVNPRLPKPATVAPYVDMAALPTTRARVQSIVHRQPAGGARFQNGDTLLARITPCLENGKTAFIDALEPNEIGIGSTEFIVLRSTGILGSHWSYFLARSTRFRDYAIRHMSGTSGRQRCSADAIGRYPIAPPEADEATRFAATATEMFAAMKDLDEEARMAARTRDELLPLLLSGRVRVDEVAG